MCHVTWHRVCHISSHPSQPCHILHKSTYCIELLFYTQIDPSTDTETHTHKINDSMNSLHIDRDTRYTHCNVETAHMTTHHLTTSIWSVQIFSIIIQMTNGCYWYNCCCCWGSPVDISLNIWIFSFLCLFVNCDNVTTVHGTKRVVQTKSHLFSKIFIQFFYGKLTISVWCFNQKWEITIQENYFFLAHPWKYFGEYICVYYDWWWSLDMSSTSPMFSYQRPEQPIFWSFSHNINSLSDGADKNINIFLLTRKYFTLISTVLSLYVVYFYSCIIWYLFILCSHWVEELCRIHQSLKWLYYFCIISSPTAAMNNDMRLSPILYYYFILDRIN